MYSRKDIHQHMALSVTARGIPAINAWFPGSVLGCKIHVLSSAFEYVLYIKII